MHAGGIQSDLGVFQGWTGRKICSQVSQDRCSVSVAISIALTTHINSFCVMILTLKRFEYIQLIRIPHLTTLTVVQLLTPLKTTRGANKTETEK